MDLKHETTVMIGTFTPGNGWQKVTFEKTVKGRYFCIEVVSGQDDKERAAIAEFDVLGKDGKPLSRENWKIRYADSENVQGGNNTANKIFDLQESTYWQTASRSVYPHHVVIDMGEEVAVTGFKYLPRMEKNYPEMIKDYKIYISEKDFAY